MFLVLGFTLWKYLNIVQVQYRSRSEKQKHHRPTHYPRGAVRYKSRGNSATRPATPHSGEVHRRRVKRRFAGADKRSRNSFGECVRARRACYLVVNRHCPAARKRTQHNQRYNLAWKANRRAQRLQSLGEQFHSPRRPKHSNAHKQQHQRRKYLGTGFKTFGRALAKRSEHIHSLKSRVSQHKNRYQRNYPICHAHNSRFRRLCEKKHISFAAATTTTSEYTETIHTHGSISNGFAAPFAARKAAAVVGTICKLAVFSTASIIISSVAEPRKSGLSSTIAFIAAIPSGVLAFPKPRTFAAMLSVINPAALPPRFTPLNKNPTIGESSRASFSTSPAR